MKRVTSGSGIYRKTSKFWGTNKYIQFQLIEKHARMHNTHVVCVMLRTKRTIYHAHVLAESYQVLPE